MNQEFIDELSVLHNLRHPRLTPIEEVRKSDNVHVIVYRTNSGNLKGKPQNWTNRTFSQTFHKRSKTAFSNDAHKTPNLTLL